ncbi:MAG: DUF177 domain-containing protein [Bacteroidetes bacterium]|nr:DUF177 domain-containing protein [Bacteroidota bacterium]
MSGAREYVINYGSLPFGEHEFEFHINDAFFQRFENSLVQKGDIDVLVVVDKKELMMLLDFTMEGHVIVECDRCLEDLELPIESYEELIVKFGEKEETESEEVIVVSTKEYELDVSQFIYEYISLQIPMRNVHDEEENGQTCDPEILKTLEKLQPQQEETPPTDSRWDGLKGINLN